MIMNPKNFPKTHYQPCDCKEYLCKFDLRYFNGEVAYFMKFKKNEI